MTEPRWNDEEIEAFKHAACKAMEDAIGDRSSFAILEGHEVVPCNMWTWARWKEANRAKPFEEIDSIVCRTEIEGSDGIYVSTVFLGMNHGFFGVDLWFETMVFENERTIGFSGLFVHKSMDEEELQQTRYTTWEEALAGHKLIVPEAIAYVIRRRETADLAGRLSARSLHDLHEPHGEGRGGDAGPPGASGRGGGEEAEGGPDLPREGGGSSLEVPEAGEGRGGVPGEGGDEG